MHYKVTLRRGSLIEVRYFHDGAAAVTFYRRHAAIALEIVKCLN